MCDATESVQVLNTLYGSDYTVCYATYGLPAYSVVCNQLLPSYTTGSITSITTFTSFSDYYITTKSWDVPSIPLTVHTNDTLACWTLPYGTFQCTDIVTGSLVQPFTTESGAKYSQLVIADTFGAYINPSNGSVSVFSLTSSPPTSFSNSFAAQRLWAGPFRICASSNTTVECIGSLTSFSQELINPAGYGSAPVNDIAIHTTTNVWTNAIGENNIFGVFNCSDTNAIATECVPLLSELGLADNVPVVTATAAAVAAEMACFAESITGALACWGSASYIDQSIWSGYTNVQDVALYNGGGCAQFTDSIDCWSYLSLSTANVPIPSSVVRGTCLNCQAGDIPYNNICYACSYGSQLITLNNFTDCVRCPLPSYRGVNMVSCSDCPTGYEPNFEQSSCTKCPAPFYRAADMPSCTACPLGTEPSVDGSTCTACVFPLVRASTMSSCSLCPWGTLPKPPNVAQCFSCSSPNYLFYSYSNTLSSYSDAICVGCPAGYGVTYASCTQCLNSTIRPVASATCYECPPGYTANASHTLCIPCSLVNPSYPVRGAGQDYCYGCPSGYVANATLSKCIPQASVQEVQTYQILLLSAGVLLLLFTAIFHKHLPQKHHAATVLVLLGLVCIAAAVSTYMLFGVNHPENVSGTAILKPT